MKLTSAQRLYGLGTLLLVALAVCSRNFSRIGQLSFLIPLAVAGAIYLLAIRELFFTPAFPRRIIFFGLALAAVWHVLFLRLPPGVDDDVHRYVWDGRVQRLGYNPYLLIPNDPALADLHTGETRTLNNPELPTPYPPGAELFFRGVTAIHESAFALKVAFVLCDALLAFVLLDLLRRTGNAEHWVLAYAWNPLLAVEVAGSGHIDIVGALALAVSAAALARRWRGVAAITFALAIAVKLLPVVLFPIYWKRVRARDALLGATVAGILCVPFLNHGRLPTGSLGTYVQRFRFNDPVFSRIETLTSPQAAAALAILFGLTIAVWMRKKSTEWSADAFAWPMAASLVCAPVVYPWYLLWLLPFLRSAATVPLLIWTVSIVPAYYVWHLRTLGGPWVLPGWMVLLEYGSVAIAAIVIGWLRIRRPSIPSPHVTRIG